MTTYTAGVLAIGAALVAFFGVLTKNENAHLQKEIRVLKYENETLQTKINDVSLTLAETAESLVEVQEMNQINLLTIEANYDTIQQMYAVPAPVYCISHHPRPGYPWILEIWWREKQLWIPLVAYNSRIAAEDVKAQLERGELEERFLVR